MSINRFIDCYSLLKEVSRQSGKPVFSVLGDFYRLRKKKGIFFEEYRDFSFSTASPEFINSFLGLREQIIYLDRLNPVKYYSLARNKYVSHCLLESFGVKMPRLLGYYHPSTSFDGKEGNYSNIEQIIEGLRRYDVHNIVIKTTESSHGDGVWVIDEILYDNCDVIFHLVNNESIKLSEILQKEVPFLIEERVVQTQQLSSFNSTSVNTIRFMTTLYPSGEAKIIGAFIKIGRTGSFIDNAGNGGNIDANIDLEMGTLENVVEFNGFDSIRKIEYHPDNGCRLEGVKIENWEMVKRMIKKYQQSCPFIKAIGWDAAITDDGPVIIEMNDFWDRTGQLFIGKGWRDEIRNCYLEWGKMTYSPVVERCLPDMSKKMIKRVTEI